MILSRTKATLLLALALGVCSAARNGIAQETATEPTFNVVLASEVPWTQLNPARGDASPQAATLWGDRAGTEATGFLVKFVDGFSSPPHIHNVTYRGMVISGGVHNDDEAAEPMWMPAGSFWTQPAGAPHITSARGTTIAYIEIDKGPYLVLPTDQAFDKGERPVNVDASNIVWLGPSSTTWIGPTATTNSNAKVAFLWGDPQSDKASGSLIKFPAGFSGKVDSRGTFRAVVIKGQAKYLAQEKPEGKLMTPGSYFSSQGENTHHFSTEGTSDCLIYVRSEGKFDVIP
ncbi:MAG: DUF4437 domain-containing protein [Pirellulaceae bacterium]